MNNRTSLFATFFLLILVGSCTQPENTWLDEEIPLNALQPSNAILASAATDLLCLAPGGMVVKNLQPGVPLDVVVKVKNVSGRTLCLQAYQQLITVDQCYEMIMPEITILERLPSELCLDADQTATTKLRLTSSEPFNPAPGCTAFAIMRVWLLDPSVDPIYSEYHDMVISFGEDAPVTLWTIIEPKQLLTFLQSGVDNGKITAKNKGQLQAFENQIAQAQAFFEQELYDDMRQKLDWIAARCDAQDIPPDMIAGTSLGEFQQLLTRLKEVYQCL